MISPIPVQNAIIYSHNYGGWEVHDIMPLLELHKLMFYVILNQKCIRNLCLFWA